MSRPIVEVQGLSKKYRLGVVGATTLRDDVGRAWSRMLGQTATPEAGEFWALRDVSFQIAPGDVIGILGRNGAGKSTLLKILSRVTEPTMGRIALRGRVASLLEVGTGFHPDLTGRENVYLNGAILGMKRAEINRRFDEIVAFAEIEKFIDTPVKHYSSGMRVRLAFAVAAFLEAEILIIDEVLAVGDAAFQKKCLGKMSEVARGGHTVLFVSHNTIAIRNLCSKSLVLEKGSVRFSGSAADGIHFYLSHHLLALGTAWRRSSHARPAHSHFESLTVNVSGAQPRLRLNCEIELQGNDASGKCFVAMDICDQSLTSVMQVLPDTQPFVDGSNGLHRISVSVELPPLIPGTYSIDLWLGQHFSTTLDSVKDAVAFEITDSPTPRRTFPHSADHGCMVPVSTYSYHPPAKTHA